MDTINFNNVHPDGFQSIGYKLDLVWANVPNHLCIFVLEKVIVELNFNELWKKSSCRGADIEQRYHNYKTADSISKVPDPPQATT